MLALLWTRILGQYPASPCSPGPFVLPLILAKEALEVFDKFLVHQNCTIAITSDFRVDGAESPEIPQTEKVLGSEIAARNRKSLATFHRTLKSKCSIAFACLE